MDYPFGFFRDDDGRKWPRFLAGQVGPSNEQKRMLVARHAGCVGCIFWNGMNPDLRGDIGECRRHPGVAIGEPDTPGSASCIKGPYYFRVWPLTRGEDWCGEFLAAPIDDGACDG
jgi:hypothetical protein